MIPHSIRRGGCTGNERRGKGGASEGCIASTRAGSIDINTGSDKVGFWIGEGTTAAAREISIGVLTGVVGADADHASGSGRIVRVPRGRGR